MLNVMAAREASARPRSARPARRWWLLGVALMPLLSCRAEPAGPRVVRVAVVQLWGQPNQLDGNVTKAARLIREAAAEGARYVVLPELYSLFLGTGNERPEELRRKAQPLGGPLTATMLSLARELGINIAYGMPERRGEEVYNSFVFVEPKGVAGVYSKRVLVTLGPPGATEADTFTTGRQVGALMWGGVATGALICADAGFDARWQDTVAEGVQLIVVPASGFGATFPGQPTVGDRARAYGVPVVLANHWSPPAGFMSYGMSRIADAAGTVLRDAGNEPDKVIVADVTIPERRPKTPAHP